MKVLSFGHIPSWAGGRQESGLANVIYQLAFHIAQNGGVDMTLAATDVYQEREKIDELILLGWNKYIIIKYALSRPLLIIKALSLSLYYSIRYRGVVSVLGYAMKMLFLSYAIERIEPDIIHLHGITAWLYYEMIPHNIKILVTIHGTCGDDKNLLHYSRLRKVEKHFCRNNRTNKIVFISQRIQQNFLRLYGEIVPQSNIILNAYDSSKFYYIKPNNNKEITLCTIASLSDLKGQMRVLEGIAKSKKQLKYICIGSDGNCLSSKLVAFAKDNQIDFVYYGKKKPEEIRELLADSDYMIMPSSSEGFGLAYLEAMACGVPVILPKDLPIVKENGIILPGDNAILLEDSSSDSICHCLLSLDFYKFDRKKVANTMSIFSWDKIAEQYVNMINTL